MSLSSSFISLVRLGIGHYADALPQSIEWQSIKSLAEQQGLSAIVVDGIEKLPEELRPPKQLLLEWIGEVIQSYENRYAQYIDTLVDMAGFYNSHDIKMMVLKGFACGLNWPNPEHRPCGDIDIWQFGRQREADAYLFKEKGIKVDKSHHHHTVFYWRDFMVENHYDFINVYDFKSSKELEKIFKSLGQDSTQYLILRGEKVYIPNANLHALFLVRHMMSHFSSSYITVRQVLDWAFFVEKNKDKIDWIWFISILKKYNMMYFLNYINAICVDDFGFHYELFPTVQFSPWIKERILEDILNPKYDIREPNSFVCKFLYKYKRWQGNAWKQKMCFNESRWHLFWRGFYAHLIKPSA